MAQLESGNPSSQQQGPPSLPQQSLDLEVRELHQPAATEGKEATIHDFLSLCGSGSTSSTVTVTKNGSQSSVTTQDLLQPLQKCLKPGSSNLLPHGFVLGATRSHTNSGDYCAGQPTPYTLVNGTLELPSNLQSKYRSSDISYVAKAHVPHGIPINKHWQQQQQQVGLDVLDGNKRLARVPSEDDDDEDDESLDHGYNPKKEIRYQKCDTTQQLEGKSMDSKGITPRSKHSATEQRRRSKINDRFQMLRQLLPNADQKRDKASFLLEVIEYIQMLHEKVKKYEAAEHGGQHQERTKTISWDRNSGRRDGAANASYVPVVSTVTYETKEAPDSNGYMRSRSSPLRVTCENGITSSELMSSMAQVSTLPNRILQAPACLSSYESKSLVSKPTPLTFTQPLAISTLERASTPMFHTVPQSMPEGRTMFGHLLHQEEQAAIKAKCSLYNKVEATALPQLQQVSNLLAPQTSNYVLDQDREKFRSPERNPLISNHRRPDEELEERLRSSQSIDMYQTEVGSTSKESGKDDSRPAHGLDGKDDGRPVHGVIDGSKGEHKGEVRASEQEPPAILGGVINISSVYSQGLLDTLTQALQSSGVDLAQATISVQIDLGKPGDSVHTTSKKTATLSAGVPPSQSKETGSSQESEHPKKRPKVEVDP